ncbi:hypothetical protein HMPREF1583_00103 [Gardnerella vaginalis JCP8151B]|nr:hypothetical protein HMPREF1583_00103 [Gardnerella vaginalis JCP8151B]
MKINSLLFVNNLKICENNHNNYARRHAKRHSRNAKITQNTTQ